MYSSESENYFYTSNIDFFKKQLLYANYSFVDNVYEKGEFAIKGSIIEVDEKIQPPFKTKVLLQSSTSTLESTSILEIIKFFRVQVNNKELKREQYEFTYENNELFLTFKVLPFDNNQIQYNIIYQFSNYLLM